MVTLPIYQVTLLFYQVTLLFYQVTLPIYQIHKNAPKLIATNEFDKMSHTHLLVEDIALAIFVQLDQVSTVQVL